jgi:hypothetical protein
MRDDDLYAASGQRPGVVHDVASGLWLPGTAEPQFYPGVQFPRTREALNEFLRIQYPEFNAPENEQIETDALAQLLNELGRSVC